MSDDSTIDLDLGERLSRAASSGEFAVHAVPCAAPPTPDPAHPAPCCWLEFGRETVGSMLTGYDVDVRVSINGDDHALHTSEGAVADGKCVAWLLTNREELIRLARIGHDTEAAAPGGRG